MTEHGPKHCTCVTIDFCMLMYGQHIHGVNTKNLFEWLVENSWIFICMHCTCVLVPFLGKGGMEGPGGISSAHWK